MRSGPAPVTPSASLESMASTTQVATSPPQIDSQVKIEAAPEADDRIQSLVKFVRGLQGVPHNAPKTPVPDMVKPSTPEAAWKPAASWEASRPPVSVNAVAGPSTFSGATPSPVSTISPTKGTSPARVMPPPPPPRAVEPTKEEDEKPIPILMPPRVSHGFFPPGPRQNQNIPPKRSHSPPPLVESKSQPYISTPTYTNPLGIRPSEGQSYNRPPYQNRQFEPKPTPAPQQNGNKKRVVVGAGWPHTRQNQNEGNATRAPFAGGNYSAPPPSRQNDRRGSWNGGPASWPEPELTPPPPPARQAPYVWPEPSARFDAQEEEYDPKNPMSGFGGPPPPLGGPPGRDGPFPPPPRKYFPCRI